MQKFSTYIESRMQATADMPVNENVMQWFSGLSPVAQKAILTAAISAGIVQSVLNTSQANSQHQQNQNAKPLGHEKEAGWSFQ